MGWRRALKLAVLWAAALWPAAHHTLVQTHGVSAWKLGGWAMFSRVEHRLPSTVMVDGQEVPPSALPEHLVAALSRMTARATRMGLLADPSEFAEVAAQALKPSERLAIIIERAGLDSQRRWTALRLSWSYPVSDGRLGRATKRITQRVSAQQ